MKNKTSEDDWKTVLENFIGYGNPNAKIFYFGLEEKVGGKDNFDRDRFKYYKSVKKESEYYIIDTEDMYKKNEELMLYDKNKMLEKSNKTLSYILKFHFLLTNTNIDIMELGHANHDVFLGNLYADPQDKHTEQIDLQQKREDLVIKFLRDNFYNQNKILVTYGEVEKFRKLIINLFKPEQFCPKICQSKNQKAYYYVYNNDLNTIYNLPHASRFWNAEFLSEVLNK